MRFGAGISVVDANGEYIPGEMKESSEELFSSDE